MALVMVKGRPCHPKCSECPYSVDGQPRHKPVQGILLARPRGVLVGEGPGADEVDKGEPFVGRTGQWLDERMVENELERGDMAILNATGCQPPKGMKTDTNMGAAAKACKPLFDAQYARYQGQPTLAMGKWASYAVTGHPITVETGRGFVRNNLIVTWHPTYAAFYNPWKAGEFVNDLQRFRRLIHGTLEAPPRVNINPTVADVLALLRTPDARAQGVDVDLETRAPHGKPAHWGKDPTRAEIRCISLGTPNLSIAYWWGSDHKVQRTIVRVIEDPKVLKGWHNGWFFDGRVLKRIGIVAQNVIDTRDMRRAVSATSRLSLRHLASLYSDFAPWKEDEK